VRPFLLLLALTACRGTQGDVRADRPEPLRVPERVLAVPNVDFTNQWKREKPDDNDIVPFALEPGTARRQAWRLTLGDGRRFHRVWHDGRVILDKDSDTIDLPWQPEPLELGLEVGDFGVATELTVQELNLFYEAEDTAAVELVASPLRLNHHLQEAELLSAVRVGSFFPNHAMIDAYVDVLGDRFLEVPGDQYGLDVWLQDEIELAYGVADDGRRMDVAIDSIRDRGLDPMPEDLLRGEDFGVMTWGEGVANSFDSFGNLETSPPVDGYPFGRIYYGAAPGASPVDQVLFDKLAAQGQQDPFQVDTSWLCVGHVDEFMTFVPDPDAPRGFRFVYTDTALAWDVLEAMDPATPLPRYEGPTNHDYATVGEIVDDAGLRALNADVQADSLDPILAQMTQELGLLPEEIVLIPGLFEAPRYCGNTVAALIPAMANLVVDNEPGGPSRLFVPDPFVRPDLGDQGVDPMIAAFVDAMPPSLEVHFLDDWVAYHLALGEVHCGTNVVRTPPAEAATAY
jgi:hypothetical protein